MIKTYNLPFYALLEGGEVLLDTEAKMWMPESYIEIIGLQASISSFPWLHAQVWLITNPEGLEQEEVILEPPGIEGTPGILGHINSGWMGGANQVIIFPPGKFISLRKGQPLYLGVWGHNMWDVLGWKKKFDFHAQYNIFYVEI